jgi:hypothetical protein
MQPQQLGTNKVGLNTYQTAVRQAAESRSEGPEAWSRRWAPTLNSLGHLKHLVPAHLHEAFFDDDAFYLFLQKQKIAIPVHGPH